jgi:hypothetical protein
VLPNITHTTTVATGIGLAIGLPSGVTAAWASNTITISGTPTVSGSFSYTIPLIGGCGTVNATGTITVTTANTVTAASSAPTLCINTALTAITHTTARATGIGTATGLPSGVTATWSTNTITISGTPTASGTFNYSIPLIGGCGTVNATGNFMNPSASTSNNYIRIGDGGNNSFTGAPYTGWNGYVDDARRRKVDRTEPILKNANLISGQSITELNKIPGKMKIIPNKFPRIDTEKVISNALEIKKNNEDGYNVFTNNCEHFVNLVKYNKLYSPQISNIKKLLSVSFFIFLNIVIKCKNK